MELKDRFGPLRGQRARSFLHVWAPHRWWLGGLPQEPWPCLTDAISKNVECAAGYPVRAEIKGGDISARPLIDMRCNSVNITEFTALYGDDIVSVDLELLKATVDT